MLPGRLKRHQRLACCWWLPSTVWWHRPHARSKTLQPWWLEIWPDPRRAAAVADYPTEVCSSLLDLCWQVSWISATDFATCPSPSPCPWFAGLFQPGGWIGKWSHCRHEDTLAAALWTFPQERFSELIFQCKQLTSWFMTISNVDS